MNKKIAFYDIVVYLIICAPLFCVSLIIGFNGLFTSNLEWLKENILKVIIFAFGIVLPIAGILLFRYYEVKNNNSVYFHYFPFTKSWDKASNNIDINWNQNVFISEVESVSIVKLSKEELNTKVFYKHWFNKYLKINLKYGNPKYVYVGNYSNCQIKKIIKNFNDK